MPMDDETARTLIGEEILGKMYECAAKGVAESFTMYPETAHIHRVTTRRSIARDHIVYHLQKAFDGDDRVRHQPKNQTDYFHVVGRFCVLVKKADDEFEVEVAKTQASLDFKRQLPIDAQLPLDTEVIPEQVNTYLSYVPGGDDPTAPDIFLIGPHEFGIEWKLELAPPAAKPDAEITAAPDVGPELGDLVIPKKDADEKKKDADE